MLHKFLEAGLHGRAPVQLVGHVEEARVAHAGALIFVLEELECFVLAGVHGDEPVEVLVDGRGAYVIDHRRVVIQLLIDELLFIILIFWLKFEDLTYINALFLFASLLPILMAIIETLEPPALILGPHQWVILKTVLLGPPKLVEPLLRDELINLPRSHPLHQKRRIVLQARAPIRAHLVIYQLLGNDIKSERKKAHFA